MIVEQGRYLILQGKGISYILRIHEQGYLLHVYYGRKLRENDFPYFPSAPRSFYTFAPDQVFLEGESQEYPAFGYNDLREGAVEVLADGKIAALSLKYKSHEISDGKPAIEGLPSSKANGVACQTLAVTLSDDAYGVEVRLLYTVFEDSDVIARHAEIRNSGKGALRLTRAFSCCLDATGMRGSETDMISLRGAWAKERNLERHSLFQGVSEIGNRTGESGHYLNPFAALCGRATTSDYGDALGAMLVYSGNHRFRVDVDAYDNIRLACGIHDGGFAWDLAPGETFRTPECLLCFSWQGLDGMSQAYHDFIRAHILPQRFRSSFRPVLINSWESMYFDFDEEKILEVARQAKQSGIELFVLDDGWFGKRNDDTTSLGDWYPNPEKLPSGVAGLAEKINALGLKFGIWVEPEMANPVSELLKAHPDFPIACKAHPPVLGRNQQVLDLTDPRVVEFIGKFLDELLSCGKISYIKWDMNRSMAEVTEPGFVHRYYLGLYKILGDITEKYPDVLFEGCSGGGGRFDAGMLCYHPQIWTSDDSDAIERLRIQEGTALCYPLSAMGAHVTACPNHQVWRTTPFSTRANVASFGTFGYELNVARLSEEEKAEVKAQIAAYRKIEPLIREGDFAVLHSAFARGNFTAWQVTSKDKKRAVVLCVRMLASANAAGEWVRLRGLNPGALYTETRSGRKYYGDELMYRGFFPSVPGTDFASVLTEFVEESEGTNR